MHWLNSYSLSIVHLTIIHSEELSLVLIIIFRLIAHDIYFDFIFVIYKSTGCSFLRLLLSDVFFYLMFRTSVSTSYSSFIVRLTVHS